METKLCIKCNTIKNIENDDICVRCGHEDKIKEIIEDFDKQYPSVRSYTSGQLEDLLKKYLKEYGNYIREKTIEECIGVVKSMPCRGEAIFENGCNDTGISESETLKELFNLKK